MEKSKNCNICGENLPIANFAKNGKKKWKCHCRNCNSIKNRMMKARQSNYPVLENGAEIEIRGKVNGKKYSYMVPYKKALQLVEDKVAYIVHETLIKKYFDRETFRNLVFSRYGQKCFYCGNFANTIDHVMPKSSGGISSFSNCVPSCLPCNLAKSNMSLDDFLYAYEPFKKIIVTSNHSQEREELLDIFTTFLLQTRVAEPNNVQELEILKDRLKEKSE